MRVVKGGRELGDMVAIERVPHQREELRGNEYEIDRWMGKTEIFLTSDYRTHRTLRPRQLPSYPIKVGDIGCA